MNDTFSLVVSMLVFLIAFGLALTQMRPYFQLVEAAWRTTIRPLESGQVLSSETLKLLIGALLIAAVVIGIIGVAIRAAAERAANKIGSDPSF